MSVNHERLHRLLGGAALERLRRRLRERILRGGGDTITLTRASGAEREAVERLLGRPPRAGNSLRLSLAEMERILQRAELAPSLREALEVLDGPLRDPARERTELQQRWVEVVAALHPRAAAADLAQWLESVVDRGLVKRLANRDPARGRELLERSLMVLEELPQPGSNRSTLAARCLGDAHALDAGQPVAALVRHALHRYWRGGVGDDDPDERTLWAHAGILIGGDITSTVLVHRLPATGDTATARALEAHSAAAEPLYLTLRQLLREPPQWDVDGRIVHVCENPAVVSEAAERLGTDCAPLVATWGRPRAAVWVLLEQLRDAGAKLLFRADFDWTGIAIANAVIQRLGARPWRMDTATLEAHATLSDRPLRARPVAACWDDTLQEALQHRGCALHEEQLLEALLEDLRR
ncbi:TIGR02679 family protein [Thioalkalivibrio halophilus]|uniref:TIGR02679 family protein n=1 Tax=Thioalkalivibrio halophilus TaxID=252474 RepID=A0A1V2ZWJ3_9GAMM|nr:TIGR02679 family protein [Thioalkalivibrio halophilus]OOC09436.1 TIGR02679 family protein [Thioalkalivibrio halophilus]